MCESRKGHQENALEPPADAAIPTLDPPAALTLCRSTHPSRPPDRYGFTYTSLLATLSSQVVQHSCWQQAMKEELDALKDNHT